MQYVMLPAQFAWALWCGLRDGILAPVWDWIGPLVKAVLLLIIVYWLFSVSLGGTNCQPSTGPIC